MILVHPKMTETCTGSSDYVYSMFHELLRVTLCILSSDRLRSLMLPGTLLVPFERVRVRP